MLAVSTILLFQNIKLDIIALQTVKSQEGSHTKNIQAAAQLQNDINRVTAIQTMSTSNADAALATSTQAQSNSTVAYMNASTVSAIQTDIPSLIFKASQERNRAQQLNTIVSTYFVIMFLS